jgi:NAD(P)-dependent dehydrogenase (short-subunit alcohol dehydrogenase family)
LTKTAALDYAREGIRINAVCLGFIKTPIIDLGTEIEWVTTAKVEAEVPIRRWGAASEIANAVLFLCGGRSLLITGAAVPVDGGYTAQ